MVYMDGHKMSKSRGNLVFVDKLRTQHDPNSIRLGLIEHHYRAEWEWDDGLMARNERRLAAWRDAASASDVYKRQDLDTPRAVALIDDAASRGVGVKESATLLGVQMT